MGGFPLGRQMTCPIMTIGEAALYLLNAQILLEQLADEEKASASPLRRGFVSCGQMEAVLVALMALAHFAYPELSDADTLDVVLRETRPPNMVN